MLTVYYFQGVCGRGHGRILAVGVFLLLFVLWPFLRRECVLVFIKHFLFRKQLWLRGQHVWRGPWWGCWIR